MSEPTIRIRLKTITKSVDIERRSRERIPCTRAPMVRVLARPSFQSFRAIVRDVSASGIGLVLTRCFEPGTLLAIQMQTSQAGFSGILTAQVKHATPQPGGLWLLGCSLSRNLSEEEVLALM